MDDQKEEREGESGGEQAAAGGCEGQQVTFLPTVRLAAFGQGGLGPIRPNARLMFRMAKRKGHLINSFLWDAHTGTIGYNHSSILTLM